VYTLKKLFIQEMSFGKRSTVVLVKITAHMDKQCMSNYRKMCSLHWKSVNFNRCFVALDVYQVIVPS